MFFLCKMALGCSETTQPGLATRNPPEKLAQKNSCFCWVVENHVGILDISMTRCEVTGIHFEKLFELFLRIRGDIFENEHEFWTNHPKLFRETKKLQQSFSSSVVTGFHEFCAICFQEWHIMHIWVVVSNMFYFQPYLGKYSHFD